MKKNLFKTIEEYRAYVARAFKASTGDFDIWEGFDQEKLNRFFKWDSENRWENKTPPEEGLIPYYLECANDPRHIELHEFRMSFEGINIEDLAECFGVKLWSDDEDEDEEWKIDADSMEFEDWAEKLTFPLVMVSWIESGFDRLGSVSFCVAEFVELKDFE